MRCFSAGSRHCERGFAAVLGIGMFLALFAVLAFSVEISNLHTGENELGSAVDAMCVSLVHLIEDEKFGKLEDIARAGIRHNLESNGVDAVAINILPLILTPPPPANPRKVELTAEVTIELPFFRIIPGGQKTAKISASASCVSRRLFLMILFDNSDSMDWLVPSSGRPKIDVAKEGLVDFLETLKPKLDDFIGVYTYGGDRATRLRKLDDEVDNQALMDEIAALDTYLGTATGDAFRMARYDFAEVLSSTTILDTDVVALINYGDGGPTRYPYTEDYPGGVPYFAPPCVTYIYDSPYPHDPFWTPPYTQIYYGARAHYYLAAIHEADLLRTMGTSGVRYYMLGIGPAGTKSTTFQCNGGGPNLYHVDDPYQCVNNPGLIAKDRFLARMANAKDIMKLDRDDDPYNPFLPYPDFPDCVAPNMDPLLGPEGESVNAEDPVTLNAILQAIAGSIRSMMTI